MQGVNPSLAMGVSENKEEPKEFFESLLYIFNGHHVRQQFLFFHQESLE